ncbi:MAG: DUF4956 domain-containing protein [Planctomycetota bacterium]|nr:DUF4956 domain-containing protein [Planctomycetota bacterium]
MGELVKQINMVESLTSVITLWQVVIGIVISGLLAAIVGLVYRRVNSETGYSQALVHAIVVIAMITCLIMMIVGSNIARAFSLVGALSIIRFRTAVKSPYDVTFIFLAIAIGMACGTGFYAVGGIATLLICTGMLLMCYLNYGSVPGNHEHLLTVWFEDNLNHENRLAPVLGELFTAYSVAYTQILEQGGKREIIYSVRPKRHGSDQEVGAKIRAVNGDQPVSFRTIRYAVEIP